MKYEKFKNILNKEIFDNSKTDLIDKIATNPDRYIGIFRPTKPKAKILQNLLQSNEIRFGDALETLFETYFIEFGYKILDKKINKNNNECLDIDQLFTDGKYVYFVEQKVRDDHDSTKKRGQIQNFEDKIDLLINIYGEKKIKAYTYFIDPGLIKNKNFYLDEINKISSNYNIYSKLVYGVEFWRDIKHEEVWGELLNFLTRWKKEIPDMPSINFDESAEDSFNEIKDLKSSLYRKLFENKDICEQILPILFPENKVPKLLMEYFRNLGQTKTIYKNLANSINNYLNK